MTRDADEFQKKGHSIKYVRVLGLLEFWCCIDFNERGEIMNVLNEKLLTKEEGKGKKEKEKEKYRLCHIVELLQECEELRIARDAS